MRVTQLVLSDAFAGTEQHVALLSRELAALGVDVRLVCGTGNGRLLDGVRNSGIRVCSLPVGPGGLPAHWGLGFRTVRQGGIDLIHAHLGNSLFCASVLGAAGPPVVFTQHFVHPAYLGVHGLRRLVRSAAHRFVHKRVAFAVAPSRRVRMQMLLHEGFAPERVQVIAHGIDTEGIQVRSRGAAGAVHRELGLSPDTQLLVTPARLEPEKGHATLLMALRQVLAEQPNVHLLLAGTGSCEAALREQAQFQGLSSHVRFMGQRADVPSLLAQAALCVLPSYEESFGLALLEAMAVGTAVVACRAGGPEDIVLHGETGLLVPSRNPQALGAAITALLTAPSRARAMGGAGQRRVTLHFSARRMAEQTLRVYEGIPRS